MSTKVVELLSQVDELSAAERAEFEAELERRRDDLLEDSTNQLKALAHQNGITDETVIDAVMEGRYGRDWKTK